MGWFSGLSLVSGWFIWGTRVALLVAVVWVVVRWSAAAKATVWAVIRRLLSLFVVSTLTVLAVVAPLNAEYGWYPTVGDLFPAAAKPATQQLASPATEAVATRTPPNPLIEGERHRPNVTFNLRPTPTNSGAGLQDFQVAGERSGVTSNVEVWFPKEYFSHPDRTFPVIMVLDGYSPSPGIYFSHYQIDQIIESLVASGTMRPAIVIAPVWALGRVDTECVDSTTGGRVETWLTQDVPAWVYSTFRVSPGRASFATFGMSAGGWCANMATMLHPNTFATAISFGAYWRPQFDPSFVPFPPDSPEGKRYNLVELAKRQPPPVALWTLYGKDDTFAGPDINAVRANARPPTSLTTTVLATGGHRIDVWQPYVSESLTWLAQTSPSFRGP